MRNWTVGLLLIITFGLWFFYVMIWKPDEVIKHETEFGDLFMGLLMGLGFALWGKELMMKYTPHLSGFGDHTELEQVEPVDTVVVSDPVHVEKSYSFGLYPRHGCKVLAMGGGGTSGYCVIRNDLVMSMDGDPSNVIAYGVAEQYKMDAAPNSEYRDLACLPREIYDMVLQHKSFHPKGTVSLYADPIIKDPRKRIETLDMMPYKDLYDSANKENKGLLTQNDALLKANSKYASANLKNAKSYAGDKQGMRERFKERREREDEEDEER